MSFSSAGIGVDVVADAGRIVFELRDLECFLGIVEHRNFGRAAAALGMTQPALSRRIALLERDLGVSLLSRANRQVELTASGEIFAREGMVVLAQAATARRVLLEVSNGSKGHLKIGTRSSARYVLIPAAIRRMRAEYPEVSITLGDPMTMFTFEQLRTGSLDVALVRGPLDLGRGLCSERLRGDPLVVALPEGHRLAAESVVDVGNLAGEPFVEIALHRGFGSKALVRGVCAGAGFLPNVVQEVETIDMLVLCVAAGIGLAVMHDASRELPMPGVLYRPLRPKKTIALYALWRAEDKNPTIAPFVRYLKEAAKALDDPL
jgi:DNA-binding transcriptional LysR family regulator